MPERSRTALILGGGGITGAAYEIGCLTALDQFLDGVIGTGDFDIVSGVSAGSIIAAAVAQGLAPERMFKAISLDEASVINFGKDDIYRADGRAVLRELRRALMRIVGVWRERRRRDIRLSFTDFLYMLQEQLPSGLFSLEAMEAFFARSYQELGLPDRFDALDRELYIAATDLDKGEHVVFGTPEHRDVRISQAIPASCAIPGFFRPFQLAGRSFVDGAYGGLEHIAVPLERGARLIVMVNPRVPLDASRPETILTNISDGSIAELADLGIGLVREQSDRIHSRCKLDMGLNHFRATYPDADLLVLEPERTETPLFLQDPMAFELRADVMHYAFQLTRNTLTRNRERVFELLRKHGLQGADDAPVEAAPVSQP